MPVQAVRRYTDSPTAPPPWPVGLAAMPDNPLHPMHRALVERWTERPDAHDDRFALPVRAIIALASAAAAWAGLIALARMVI
jgi:hypothetical protein